MGDRVLIVVKSGDEIAPCCAYLHWSGSECLALLKAAISRMRCGDVGYSTARLIGMLHEALPTNLGLGVFPAPEKIPPPDSYSHGDAGVVVYDCLEGTIECFGGYLVGSDEAKNWKPLIPPG